MFLPRFFRTSPGASPSDQTVLQALERSCFGAQGFAWDFPPGGIPVDLGALGAWKMGPSWQLMLHSLTMEKRNPHVDLHHNAIESSSSAKYEIV